MDEEHSDQFYLKDELETLDKHSEQGDFNQFYIKDELEINDAPENSNTWQAQAEKIVFHETQAKCGDVFVGYQGNFTLVCSICRDEFETFDSFGIHIKEGHLGLKSESEVHIEQHIFTDPLSVWADANKQHFSVMPALHERSRPVEGDWSKTLEDDIVEQLFSATFPAFKFPDRERLHVSCGVQLCKGKCPQVNCKSGESLHFSSERQLARIEVFNSLAVTAPQIEIDRLRSDRRYNMSVEEYPPKLTTHSDGTLCLSVSKLAIAFCVLGIIFLTAVIISVCCLIRSRSRRNQESLRPSNTSMFSSSSDSQSRFGSKLLIPYGASGSLPYGRVY